MATDLLIRNARILTLEGPLAPRRMPDLKRLGVIEHGWLSSRRGRITSVEPGEPSESTVDSAERIIDARGNVVMPAFVDCHTHACWAGDRLDEFEMRLAGRSYLDILKSGGGIMSTVRATREASKEDLTDLLLLRLARMQALGTATVEVKSGYGLDTDNELKMLDAIRAAAGRTRMQVVPTFLGAHAIDPEIPDFVEYTINETLREVVQAYHGITCDAYCEEGAWSLEDCRRLFEEAQSMGCPIRVHADQFNSLGMTRLAVETGARSVDHLEATNPRDLEFLARSDTIGVALPCSGFHLDDRYAPARAFVDAGGALAIATNYNPGSAPTPSMPFVLALACRRLRLTPAEAITASTYNAACVLHLEHEIGSLEPGKRADVQVLDCADERDLAYDIAGPGPAVMIVRGQVVHERPGTKSMPGVARPH